MSVRSMMEIRCPKCGKASETEAVQSDGAAFLRESRTCIDDVPVLGFRMVQSMTKIVVHCDECQIVVWQNPQ
jgi:endogenous inhibitor of DNA gyrase (YacG/DUF329 family)